MTIALSASAEESYVYINKLKKIFVPPSIYSKEKASDFFNSFDTPANTFKVIPYDLNNDGKPEYFVSNPDNNGLYFYFWRIYEHQGKDIMPVGEMGCTAIRLSPVYTDGYQDIECYSYISLVEGYLKTYRHFGRQYYSDNQRKVHSKEFFPDSMLSPGI